MVKSYQQLDVWRKGIELVKRTYSITDRLPGKERYSLCDQMQRAAVSVPANIAEGWARESERDFLRFVMIAKGSLAELETLIVVADELAYLETVRARAAQDAAAEVGRMLSGLQKSLKNQIDSRQRPTANR